MDPVVAVLLPLTQRGWTVAYQDSLDRLSRKYELSHPQVPQKKVVSRPFSEDPPGVAPAWMVDDLTTWAALHEYLLKRREAVDAA